MNIEEEEETKSAFVPLNNKLTKSVEKDMEASKAAYNEFSLNQKLDNF
jgi:hypothetical protein